MILIVDDNEAGQMLVRAVLKLTESPVASTGSAEAVLHRLSGQPIRVDPATRVDKS